jgi:hypothetical protein
MIFEWPSSSAPFAFYDLSNGTEEMPSNSKSFFNRHEANVSIQLGLTMATDPTVESVVILTPYKAQVRLLGRPRTRETSQ